MTTTIQLAKRFACYSYITTTSTTPHNYCVNVTAPQVIIQQGSKRFLNIFRRIGTLAIFSLVESIIQKEDGR